MIDIGLYPALITRAVESRDAQTLLNHCCQTLNAHGFPIWRATLGLEFLHPEVSGTLSIWVDGDLDERQAERVGILNSDAYLRSPSRIVDETNAEFIRQLDVSCPDMPLLEDLRQKGATGYAMFPLPFIDATRSANMSFTTRKLGGFSDTELNALRAVVNVISPYAERLVLQRLAIDLLETYTGPRTGARILSGEIDRGHFEMISAAIWFADLRGFTSMADTRPMVEVMALLDRWFNFVGEAIEAWDGEILKFMGDGALAIFPAPSPDKIKSACENAFAAAKTLYHLQLQTSRPEQPAFDFGLGLHFGDIAYGNIGSSRRLDFTVIGPAVNEASRLEQLTKASSYHVAASATFRSYCDGVMTDGGVRYLEGVGEPKRVFFALPKNKS